MYVGASPNEERAVIDAHETYPRARALSRRREVLYCAADEAGAAQCAGFRAQAHRTAHGTPT